MLHGDVLTFLLYRQTGTSHHRNRSACEFSDILACSQHSHQGREIPVSGLQDGGGEINWQAACSPLKFKLPLE